MSWSARSLLFVPGHRPERFAKALATAADLVCIDLEDAVPLSLKEEARAAVAVFIGNCSRAEAQRLVIRVSPTGTAAGQADCTALAPVLAQSQNRPAYLMLAKTESAAQLAQADAAIGSTVPWIALVESPAGLLDLNGICTGTVRPTALMFGGGDFAAELGADFAWEPLLFARSQLMLVAAANGLPAIDVPFLDINDAEMLQQETRRVRALGYSCKAAIHPRQLDGIHQGFAPSEQEVLRAEKIIEAFAAANGGAVTVDGRMIDQPIVDSARRTLALAGRTTQDVSESQVCST